ncbi:MAG: ATP-binding protein [Desulfocapsaceae bacterium]|nr:ATP-binding protein [Desulfocapsaceae bacterium]
MMMKRSLQRRLTVLLGVTILVSGLLSAIISFILAYAEAKEFQDDTLRQIALLVSRSTETFPENKGNIKEYASLALNDTESRIGVIHLPGDSRPSWLAENLSPGLHTIKTGDERLRIFLRKDLSGKITVVTQPTDTRDEIAINSALRTFVPLLFFLPVMAWLIMHIIRGQLVPVRNLTSHLDQQPTERPYPLSDKDIPDEIIPFVHAINRLLERVVKLIGQQRRFVADAAHELRTPLTALSIQVQNLQQAGSLESMKNRILPLQNGIERSRKLTEQLLNLARIQAGLPKAATVDVSSMSRNLIAEYLPMAEAKNIDLGLDETAPLTLSGVPENLRLILKNALENALLYTPAGGEITVRLLSSVDDRAGFEILDNGPGIPVTELERVFDPFYRLPGTTGDGSGLGLAIAMEAAASLGGRVILMNRLEGHGLVFRYLQGCKNTALIS